MMDKLHIEGAEVVATSPEGKTARMPLEAFLAKIAPRQMDTGDVVLPDGVKAVIPGGSAVIWVYECPPQPHSLLWIAGDSTAQFGKGTRYRTVRLSLPYLIVLAVFEAGDGGQLVLSGANECFFRVAPLKSLDDKLLFPALLNCSKFTPPEGRPLSWICTQYLDYARLAREPDPARRMGASFAALRHCLLETGFNYSSEHHEGASWFGAARGVDPRISTVENWQAATEQDPLFALEVPWLPTGLTVRQMAERIFQNLGAHRNGFASATALARVVFHHR
jgi:hypothetical protein